MNISLYIQSVDKQLSRTLHKAQHTSSTFAWYLAVQTTNAQSYHPKDSASIEHDLPYKRISLPSAPKSSLYTQNKHYSQYAKLSEALHRCDNPSALIQFYNNLQPQSLQYTVQEQKLPLALIENLPVFTQLAVKQQTWQQVAFDTSCNKDGNSVEHGGSGQAFNSFAYSDQSLADLPFNAFADATFANVEQAILSKA